jgi:predicted amidohydrolase YtcJ
MNNAGFDKNQISFTMEGGTIDIDDNHEITGIFRENAIKIITSTLQKSKSIEQKKKFLKDGLEICLKSGITSVQTNDELCYHAYQELQKEDDISIRVFFTPCIQDLHIDTNMGGIKNIEPIRSSNLRTISPIDANSNTISDWKQDSLTMERVKLFSDGSLGAETAALRLSIDDKKPSIYNHSGVLIYSYDNLIADIELATKNGYRVEIHAIGDAAVEQVF